MMDDSTAAQILSEISAMMVLITGPDADGSFLYAEAENAHVATSLFKDEGDFVQYFECGDDLAMRVLDLWYATDKNKKWAALFLTIEGDHFDARFQYREEWGEEDQVERREMIVAAKYGNKEVRYPSLKDMDCTAAGRSTPTPFESARRFGYAPRSLSGSDRS